MKVLDTHIPDISVVNEIYWKYDYEERVLEGLGYVCPACGCSRIVKLPVIDENTGMVAWDQCDDWSKPAIHFS